LKLDGTTQVKQLSTPSQHAELYVVNRKKDKTLLSQASGVIGKRGRSERQQVPEIAFKRLASYLPKGLGRD
jgi:hypothetical protein